jgi:RNA polymerase sigma factor (sigma-70 family)
MGASSAERSRHARVQVLAAELYREHRGQLLSIARRNAADRTDAEEALQDALAAFIRFYDPRRGAPPLAWLTLTLKRRCWALRNSRHLDRSAGQEAAAYSEEPGVSLETIASERPDAEESIERAESTLDARKQLSFLKPDERRALVLFSAGFSFREIGERCGWTYTKVNRAINEGRAALRAQTNA